MWPERLYGHVPRHHQRQRGRLDAPHRQHATQSGVLCPERHGPRGVHAHKPVGPRTRAGRVPQGRVLPVVPHLAQRLAHGLRRQTVIKPEPFHRPAIPEMFKHLINKHLPLAIRIAAVDHGIRPGKQIPQNAQLPLRLLFRLVLPCIRYDGQVIH